jgi:S-methylmethionine-dependent homocysteine/selenocysteine methylase
MMVEFGRLKRPVLLDGGVGVELIYRGVEIPTTIWAANALLAEPEEVRQVHIDFIDAGADVITTNTYGVIQSDLAKEGIEERFAELNELACTLAQEARDTSERPVFIAGSLPPFRGSYRPDLVGSFKEIEPLYREQAEIMAPYVDFYLCETMSSAEEARAAATAASSTGKPVWVAWTLHEDRSGRLRSGETITEAVAALDGLQVAGILANCSAPESITNAMPEMVRIGSDFTGGYANIFYPIPKNWLLGGEKMTDQILDRRDDLDPERYARHAMDWIEAGATVIGGCCGTRPAHIAKLKELLDRG